MEQIAGWGAALLLILTVIYKFLKSYLEKNKKIIELEYKNEKAQLKEAHKDDSIDVIIERIDSRYRGDKPE